MSNPIRVVTFGETMLRLSPPNHRQISQAQQVEMHVGGSESNVAIGLANLGVEVAWFSALPDNQLGHYVERAIHAQGVDTSFVHWAQTGRLGIYWVEQGAPPRSSKVIYDREHTSISQMQVDNLPQAIFDQEHKGILHLSGITPALSHTLATTTQSLMQQAKQAGWLISFDLNYRAKLWEADTARAGCNIFLQHADIVFAPMRDIQQVFGIEGSASYIFQQFHSIYPQATLVMTMGGDGAMAGHADSETVIEGAFTANPIDRVGAGDAFVAGFLSQLVEHNHQPNLSGALRWANACAALKYTVVGDMLIINRSDVLDLLNSSSTQHIQR